MRLLIADGSQLMVRLVAKLVPPGTEVLEARRVADARDLLDLAPPDGAVITASPSHDDWRRLVALCQERDRPIPFVLCSTVDGDLAGGLGLPCRPVAVLSKPVRLCDLRTALAQLLEAAGAGPR